MTVKENDKRITDLEGGLSKAAIFLFGNGDKIGLDEKFRNLSNEVNGMRDTQHRMESDLKEVKRMMQDVVGYAGVKYDAQTHPSRRESDKKELGITDRFVVWFADKVAPGLLQAIIVFSFSFAFWLLVSNWFSFTG